MQVSTPVLAAQPTFDALSQIATTPIPAAAQTLRTAGYTSAGDGGGGQYKRVNSQPAYVNSWVRSADRFQASGAVSSVNGGYWIYMPEARGVNAKAFGALGTGAVNPGTRAVTGPDDTAALQSAIDFSIYSAGCPCFVPAGTYVTSDVLSLGYGLGGSETGVLEGAGSQFTAPSSQGTVIATTFSDRPAIAIQGARMSRVRHIAVFGVNYHFLETASVMSVSGAQTFDDTVLANWIGPSMAATCNGRYTPYAAFAVDPYSGVAPGSAYPAVTYPAFLGSSIPQYGKGFSSDVLIEDVSVCGFVAVLAIQPCDADGNGDFIGLRDVNASNNCYVVTCGNSQGRCLTIDRGVFGNFHTGIANGVHGRQIGQMTARVSGSHFASCIQVLDVANGAYAGGLTFTACYGEAVWRLGRFNTQNAGATDGMTMIGCKWDFGGQTVSRGIPTKMLDGGGNCPVCFINTGFSNFYSVMLMGGNGSQYEVINCVTLPLGTGGVSNTRTNTFEQMADNYLGGGWMFQFGVQCRPARFSNFACSRWNLTTGIANSDKYRDNLPCKRDFNACAWVQTITPYGTSSQSYFNPQTWGAIAKSSLTSVSLTGKELTLVYATLNDYTSNVLGPAPGDVLYDDNSGSVFFVHSRSTTTVLATLQNNFKLVGGVYTTCDTAFSTTAGNIYVGMSRLFTPNYYTKGDIVAGNITATNVGRGDGFFGVDIAVGDWFWTDNTVDRYAVNSNAQIASVTGGSNQLTISTGGFGYTQVGKVFSLFCRAPPANM